MNNCLMSPGLLSITVERERLSSFVISSLGLNGFWCAKPNVGFIYSDLRSCACCCVMLCDDGSYERRQTKMKIFNLSYSLRCSSLIPITYSARSLLFVFYDLVRGSFTNIVRRKFTCTTTGVIFLCVI